MFHIHNQSAQIFTDAFGKNLPTTVNETGIMCQCVYFIKCQA